MKNNGNFIDTWMSIYYNNDHAYYASILSIYAANINACKSKIA